MQFELWAKRRPTENQGFQYELVKIFYNEVQVYYMLESLDKNIYEEGLVLRTEWQQFPSCVLYEVFEKPSVKRK